MDVEELIAAIDKRVSCIKSSPEMQEKYLRYIERQRELEIQTESRTKSEDDNEQTT